MTPRPYRLGQRQVAADETRARILAAARELLSVETGFPGFSVDHVAKQAGVSRMTVYHQFGSRAGLLEALFDELGARGGMRDLRLVFTVPDALDALDALVETFGRFWSSSRLAIRRIRALGSLDPELEAAIRMRDGWRREAARTVLRRLQAQRGVPPAEALDEAIRLLLTLTSFEVFDLLAGPERGPADVVPRLQRLCRDAVAGLGAEASPPRPG